MTICSGRQMISLIVEKPISWADLTDTPGGQLQTGIHPCIWSFSRRRQHTSQTDACGAISTTLGKYVV
jgi:hypothetical protein